MPDAASYIIGIDVGVTNVKTVCITPRGEILAQESTPTHAQTPDWPSGVRAALAQIENKSGPAVAVGVAAPGIANPDGRSIWWMQGRLQAVQGLNWTDFLKRAQPVPVLNDAQAALLGEAWIGAAKGARSVVLLTLGTGVGGAIMVDGRLLRGHLGRAGHLGHLSLDPNGLLDISNTPGSLEEAIGNCTVSQRTHGRFSSTHELIAAYVAGDLPAREIWLRSVKSLAAAIASLINIVDPRMVVVGGGIALAGDALFVPLAEWMDQFEWRPHGQRVPIAPAMLGEYAGAIGAARRAADNFIDKSLKGPNTQ